MRYAAWDEVIELDESDILEAMDDDTAMMDAWFAEGDRMETEGWVQPYGDEFTADEVDDASFVASARNRISILFPILPRAGFG